eukprot:PhM_4_TR1152/c0_g1_i1/m.11317/K00548/metH, MTR; 5-methyltetrahydrofolate--homocysteine methyltransferase
MKRPFRLTDGAIGTRLLQLINPSALKQPSSRLAHEFILPDMYNKTHYDIVRDMHVEYLTTCGCDAIKTNTFNAQSVSLPQNEDVEMINRLGVKATLEAIHISSGKGKGDVRVLASVGPTSKSLSAGDIRTDVLRASYEEQVTVLLQEGVNVILIETIADEGNAEAALKATENVAAKMSQVINVILSVVLSPETGETLFGAPPEEFFDDLLSSHKNRNTLNFEAIGFNCCSANTCTETEEFFINAFERLGTSCRDLFQMNPGLGFYWSPNAGFPDPSSGCYPLSADDFTQRLIPNVVSRIGEHKFRYVGGCCGTTPLHLKV